VILSTEQAKELLRQRDMLLTALQAAEIGGQYDTCNVCDEGMGEPHAADCVVAVALEECGAASLNGRKRAP
jgi:hypothetical protein